MRGGCNKKKKQQQQIRDTSDSIFSKLSCMVWNSKASREHVQPVIYIYMPPLPKIIKMRERERVFADIFPGRKSTAAPPRRSTTVWPSPYSPYYPRRTERPSLREPEYDRPEENRRGASSAHSTTGENTPTRSHTHIHMGGPRQPREQGAVRYIYDIWLAGILNFRSRRFYVMLFCTMHCRSWARSQVENVLLDQTYICEYYCIVCLQRNPSLLFYFT